MHCVSLYGTRVATANPGTHEERLTSRRHQHDSVDVNTIVISVFAITTENGRPSGAVEIVQRFDNIWAVAFRYLKSDIWMSLIAIALVTGHVLPAPATTVDDATRDRAEHTS